MNKGVDNLYNKYGKELGQKLVDIGCAEYNPNELIGKEVFVITDNFIITHKEDGKVINDSTILGIYSDNVKAVIAIKDILATKLKEDTSKLTNWVDNMFYVVEVDNADESSIDTIAIHKMEIK